MADGTVCFWKHVQMKVSFYGRGIRTSFLQFNKFLFQKKRKKIRVEVLLVVNFTHYRLSIIGE